MKGIHSVSMASVSNLVKFRRPPGMLDTDERAAGRGGGLGRSVVLPLETTGELECVG